MFSLLNFIEINTKNGAYNSYIFKINKLALNNEHKDDYFDTTIFLLENIAP